VVAVGRAILPPRNRVRGRWEIRASRAPGPPGGPLLAVSPNVRLGGGSVYVVDRGAFLENAALHEWKSGRPVRVLAEVAVTANDYVALGGRIETRPVPVVGDRSPGPPGTASAPGRGRVRSGES
jgi:hypothetical protein